MEISLRNVNLLISSCFYSPNVFVLNVKLWTNRGFTLSTVNKSVENHFSCFVVRKRHYVCCVAKMFLFIYNIAEIFPLYFSIVVFSCLFWWGFQLFLKWIQPASVIQSRWFCLLLLRLMLSSVCWWLDKDSWTGPQCV